MAQNEDVADGECERNKGGHDDDPELLLRRVIVFHARVLVEKIVLQHQLNAIFQKIAEFKLKSDKLGQKLRIKKNDNF